LAIKIHKAPVDAFEIFFFHFSRCGG